MTIQLKLKQYHKINLKPISSILNDFTFSEGGGSEGRTYLKGEERGKYLMVEEGTPI